MDKSKLVITIERQYGSGGRIVGKKLAEELHSFYDDEILSMTAEKSAVGENISALLMKKQEITCSVKLSGICDSLQAFLMNQRQRVT